MSPTYSPPPGQVTDELIDFHVEHAAGGVGMTTVAYCAVAPEGRTDRHQIVWQPEVLPGPRRLTEAVHAQGAAARMAIEAGFDAVEVHLGHNYLISSFLSPRLNRRRDDYGTSLAGRARLALETMRAVRDAVGHRIVSSRYLRSYPYQDGYLLDDARRVRAAVDVPMVLLSGISNRPVMDRAMAESFQFVAMGRALLRETDLINWLQAEPSTKSLCDHSNRYMPTIFTGTRCLLPPEHADAQESLDAEE